MSHRRSSTGKTAPGSANLAPFPWLADEKLAQNLLSEQQRNIETLRQWNEIFIKAAETLTTQQVAAAKALTDQFTNGTGNLFGARAPEEWGAAQADFMRIWLDTWFAQAQAAVETGSRCCADAAGVISKRCAEAAGEAKSVVSGEGTAKK